MIPEGWKTYTLGELSDPQAPIRYGVVQIGPFVPGGVPIVPIKHINQLGRASLHLASRAIEGRYANSRIRSGDVLLSVKGTIGEVGIVPEGFHGNIAREIARIRPNNRVDSRFLFYLLAASETRQRIENLVVGTTRREFSIAAVRAFQVVVPPIDEQRRIASVLLTWDRAIEAVEALIANARAQKTALMQALLTGRVRLPGFSGEWDHKSISAIATRVTRRNDGTDLPVLTISSTSGFVRQDEKYRREMAGKSVENYIVLNRGEFAYNKGNSKTYQFGCIYELDSYERALVPHVYVCFRLKPAFSRRFFAALFEADYLAPQLRRLVNTGVRNNGLLNITPSEVLGTTVPVPPADEQDAIAAVLEAASATVAQAVAQRDALRQEKAALMQQLLTGQRRVRAPESEAA
ncbi:restriction endonuclease subunit S [Phenylobacterium sp.]|uniref:restriction endonuclease subunit S n=1 Tax=Phenylobacterium sp. TaxID=1871053 RepID=UPI0035AECA22